jgi:hypothetical protein
MKSSSLPGLKEIGCQAVGLVASPAVFLPWNNGRFKSA